MRAKQTLVDEYVWCGCRAFVDEDFSFFGRIIDGKKQQPQRWKVCVDRLDKSLGDLTGKYYAQQMFNAASKAAASNLIDYIEQAMSADIQTLTWMDAPTRSGANDKMAKLSNLVGYLVVQTRQTQRRA
jgi:putative endopeptidase